MDENMQIPHIDSDDRIEILKGVVALIREEPLRYNQQEWFARQSDDNEEISEWPACGTVCCVAGWVAVAKDGVDACVGRSMLTRAQEILALDNDQSLRLFSGSALDEQFISDNHVRGAAFPRPGTREYVELGVRHIERFMRDELGYDGPAL